ncbi:MAG: hypothetical protein IJ897_00805 [Prevotella sp.]|nr:hypothetical protein [Prevotella sp.]
MDRIDIEKLRSLPCEGVAQRLGLVVRQHKVLCPFHNDHTPSLTFKREKWRCWSCGEGGDTISLVQKVLHKDFLDACRWLADENNVILTEYKPKEEKPPKPFDSSRYERFFERPWLNDEARAFLFDERRLDPRVVRWCRLTSWKDKQGVSWLQIPYYDREGKLVGVQNRNLTPSRPPQRGGEDAIPQVSPWGDLEGVREGAAPRFRFPQGSQCGIYNLPVLNLLKPGEELWITEGCSDCWAMLSSGHKAIAIPSATLLTQDVRSKMADVRSNSSLFTLHLEQRSTCFPTLMFLASGCSCS